MPLYSTTPENYRGALSHRKPQYLKEKMKIVVRMYIM